MTIAYRLCAALMLVILYGCASITATKITPENRNTIVGQVYSLPKPVIEVIPQADDTVLVNVLFLADSDNSYAIDTSSNFSSYSYQVALNQNQTLAAIEYKQDTSAIGQQFATSAATAETQVANIRNANMVALQSAVNTAQNNADTAQSTYDKQRALVAADIKNGVSTATLNADQATADADLAALQDAKAVLLRTRGAAQTGSYTATAGAPVASSSPAPTGNSSFGAQTWADSQEYDLPERHGAVLYMVNESRENDGSPKVELIAAKLEGDTQHDFKTVNLTLGPPVLSPSSQNIVKGMTAITLRASQPIDAIKSCAIKTTADVVIVANATCKRSPDDSRSITVTLPATPKLKPDTYKIDIAFSYKTTPDNPPVDHEQFVMFTVH
ncbi:hypothetical protein AB3X91_33720 [Paraburkholderia sp. BR14263]